MTAAPDTDTFVFSEIAAVTRAWAPGTYWWTIRATSGDDVAEVATGQTTILPDMVASSDYDGRTDYAKGLEAIDAVLEKRASIDQQRYVINNRELWRTPISDLLKLRAHYANLVARERAKANGRRRWGRAVQVLFS